MKEKRKEKKNQKIFTTECEGNKQVFQHKIIHPFFPQDEASSRPTQLLGTTDNTGMQLSLASPAPSDEPLAQHEGPQSVSRPPALSKRSPSRQEGFASLLLHRCDTELKWDAWPQWLFLSKFPCCGKLRKNPHRTKDFSMHIFRA